MQHSVKKEVTYIKDEYVKTTCDHCGAVIPKDKAYDTRDAEFEYTKGSSYPEGGSKEGWNLGDLCDICIARMCVILIEHGFTIFPVSKDW